MDEKIYFGADLLNLKGIDEGAEDSEQWNIQGIASSEGIDEEGDAIFKNVLDINYFKKCGFINWNHASDPSNQLGYITKAEIIQDTSKYADQLGRDISPRSSLYIEGELYKNVKKAREVRDILKSVTSSGGLGLSIEGNIHRTSKKITSVVVRGVAITPMPVQTETLCNLVKSLQLSLKNLSDSDALLIIMNRHPNISFTTAESILEFAKRNKNG